MTASAFHLFCDLYQRRKNLASNPIGAEDFMWHDDLIAGRGGKGGFPDLVLCTNQNHPMFQGGEFIEIKDAKQSYSIPSFNSTIPSAYKNVQEHISQTGELYAKMLEADGVDPYLLAQREVYYLVRGRKNSNCKVCLIHGSFFETVSAEKNIKSALKKALTEAMEDSNLQNNGTSQSAIDCVTAFKWKREHLAKVRQHTDAAVSIRMRVMSEVIKEANPLNASQYPAITDNTLNMIVSAHPESDYEQLKQNAVAKMATAFGVEANNLPTDLTIQRLLHLRNGPFVLFQTKI